MFARRGPRKIPYRIENEDPRTVRLRINRRVWKFDRLECPPLINEAGNPVDVVVDVSRVHQMTTAAFAQLVAMNTSLRLHGGSMRTEGLQAQPRGLCEILGLGGFLLDSCDGARVRTHEKEIAEPGGVPHVASGEFRGCGGHAASNTLRPVA